MSRRRAPIRAALLLGLGLALPPLPAAAAEPRAEAPASRAAEPARPFAMSLHRANDLVPQTDFVQCVGASMQTMLNVMARGADRSAMTQLRLQRLARKWSGPRPDGRIRHGASVRGWADGLTLLGVGPYKLVGERTLDDALRTAAIAIRETGKPVGLLMWRGRHAWVMTGFRATGDPLRTDAFRVTAVNVFDPLYPHGSGVWGPSPRPGALIGPAALGRQFLPRRSNARSALFAGLNPLTELRGKYVLVLPYLPRPLTPRDARVL
jgi:hypothetical protein